MVYAGCMQTPARSLLPSLAALLCTASARAVAADAPFVWTDTNAWTQIADWEDPANWAGGRVPANAAGQPVAIHTPDIGKYQRLRTPVTLGSLAVTGTNAPSGGFLGLDGGDGRLRFDNGGQPALLDYRREGRDFIDIPVEFSGALVITNGVALPPLRQWRANMGPHPGPTSLFFGKNASLCPISNPARPTSPTADVATVTFVVNRSLTPWMQGDVLLHRTQNVLACPVEDAEDGSTKLRLVKDGPGALTLASADNAYSGGTIVAGGPLCGVNGENFDPPFLPFGVAPLVEVLGKDSFVRLYSSMPGTWGPGAGYDFRFRHGGTLLVGDAFGWNHERPLAPPTFTVGSVEADEGNLSLRLEGQTSLVISESGRIRLGAGGELHIRHMQGPVLPGPLDVTLRGSLEVVAPDGATNAPLRKTGNGWIRLEGATLLPGGLDVSEGLVCAAHDAALGTGPCHVASNAVLAIDAPNFHSAASITQEPGSFELWLDPLARLGSAPDAAAEWRMPDGVGLYIGASLRDLSNKTIAMTGGRLAAFRTGQEGKTPAYALGPGITVALEADLVVGHLHFPARDGFDPALRERPLRILGPVIERGGSRTLVKEGSDRLEIGGVCTHTGGTDVRSGELAVLRGGRLAPGEVRVGRAGRYPSHRVLLRLGSPDALAPSTTLRLGENAIVVLDFDGTATIDALDVQDEAIPPGDYGDGDCGGTLTGKGRLRVRR